MIGWMVSRARRILPALALSAALFGLFSINANIRGLLGSCQPKSTINSLVTNAVTRPPENMVTVKQKPYVVNVSELVEEEVRGLLEHRNHPNLVQDEPVLLHILAYQRTASSVISRTLGDLPGQFFLYEPLDMTFTSLYNTAPGWNIPSDIFNDHDGQIRSLDETELQAMQFTMDTIFKCRISEDLPLTFLLHSFWHIFGSSPMSRYKHCISSRGHHRVNGSTLFGCQKRTLKGVCGGHYNSGSSKLKQCADFTWRNGSFTKDFVFPQHAHPTAIRQIKSYKNCLKPYETPVRNCAKIHLDDACKKASIRVIKTVRSNMEVAKVFFDKYDNFRLLHLFRDPRGTVKSRLDAGWSLGSYDKKNLTRAAQLYCQNVVSDIERGRRYEEAHPGKMMTMLSDDFVDNPLPYLEEIASLIGKNATATSALLTAKFETKGIKVKVNPHLNLTNTLIDENISNTLTQRKLLGATLTGKRKVRRTALKGEKRLQRWQTSLTWSEVKTIEGLCAGFYSNVDWEM